MISLRCTKSELQAPHFPGSSFNSAPQAPYRLRFTYPRTPELLSHLQCHVTAGRHVSRHKDVLPLAVTAPLRHSHQECEMIIKSCNIRFPPANPLGAQVTTGDFSNERLLNWESLCLDGSYTLKRFLKFSGKGKATLILVIKKDVCCSQCASPSVHPAFTSPPSFPLL